MPEAQITEADIERMKHGFELYNAGEFDGLRELMAPDVVLERVGGLEPLRGWDEVRAFFEPDAFESQSIEPLAWETQADKALLHVRIRSVGAGSGLVLDLEGWFVWTIADHVVTHIRAFTTEAEARVAFDGQNDSS